MAYEWSYTKSSIKSIQTPTPTNGLSGVLGKSVECPCGPLLTTYTYTMSIYLFSNFKIPYYHKIIYLFVVTHYYGDFFFEIILLTKPSCGFLPAEQAPQLR